MIALSSRDYLSVKRISYGFSTKQYAKISRNQFVIIFTFPYWLGGYNNSLWHQVPTITNTIVCGLVVSYNSECNASHKNHTNHII